MVKGEIHDQLGWRARGRGYANSVSESGWDLFEKHQTIAAKEFQNAFDANPLFPESAAEMISISMAGYNEKSTDFWFEKSIAGQIDYLPAYDAKLFSCFHNGVDQFEEMFEFAIFHAGKKAI